jgi:DNA-directed RNA polymerase sigma subunit (sigma70/sigma32)
MINSKGIIQNNRCVTDFIRYLKQSKTQYKLLSKKEERQLIEKYTVENNEGELRKLLIMHNIRMVFSIAKQYCKDTRDFDNMVSKGLFGLVFAANIFNLFEPITTKKQIGTEIVKSNIFPFDPVIDQDTGLVKEKPIYENVIKINKKTNKPEFVKFCTYATNWVFKYIVEEFNERAIKIDNNSISLNDKVKIKNSVDNNQSMENYIDNKISPDYSLSKPTDTIISDNELSILYSKLSNFIEETNELTSLEKKVVMETFYNHKKIKDIVKESNSTIQKVVTAKKKALKKLKNIIVHSMKIKDVQDYI